MKDTLLIDTPTPNSPIVSSRRGAAVVAKSDEQVVKTAEKHGSELVFWRYQIENPDFAKGAYGKVLLANDKISQSKVVVKKIPITVPERMIVNEVKAGRHLGRHENIVKLHQHIEAEDSHYLIFEYVQSQDLFCYLEKTNFKPMAESEARHLILQLLKACEYIHNHNIAHRDIKLENILINENKQITLIDFGLCAFIEEGRLCRDWCGSDNYLAPEICRRTPYDGYKADVFSTGVVLFALLFGVFPFDNLRVNANLAIVKPIRTLKVSFPSDVKVSDSAKNLLEKMLADDPSQRFSLKEVLEHEWINADNTSPTASPSSSSSCESALCPTA